MSVDRSDRCPRCGAPYMSSLAPGEVDNRVCYSCNSGPAAPDPAAPVDDELSLQPLEGGTSDHHPAAARGNVRRQMERQIRTSGVRAGVTSKANLPAVKKAASNAAMPAARAASHPAMPAVKPAGRSTQAMPAVRTGGSTRTNLPAAHAADAPAPEADPVEEAAAAPAPAPRLSSARMAAVRSSARHRAVRTEASGPSPVIYAVLGAVVLGVGAVIYFALGKNGENTPVASVAPSASSVAPKPAASPAAAAIPPVRPAEEAKSVEPAASATPAPQTTRPEPAKAAAAETLASPLVPAAEEPKAANAEPRDLNKELFAPKRNNLDDEEALVEMESKAAKKSAPAPAAGKDAADKTKPVDALAGMGITGTKKAKPEEDAPVFDDIRKPKPVIPVTATEPTIIKEDLTQGDQNPEKQFSLSIQEQFPGWRVRDVTLENTQFTSAEHRGKRDVLILNPMNDTLPAKLHCTVEIPKDFAGRRPMLAFEVSTIDKTADWILAVKCMNVDVRPKAPIRCNDEVKWMPVGVDLSALAGKRFDLAIEAYMTPRTNNKKWRDERAYIRNVQLLWQGKK